MIGNSPKRLEMGMRHAVISRLRDIDVIGIRMLTQLLPRLLIPPPQEEMILRTLHGFDLWIDPKSDRGVERKLYYTGTYEKGTLYLLSQLLRTGDTFVDVGANIGLMSVHASRIVGATGRVLAFEPNPATREILSFNVELNACSNVEVLSHAVGSIEQSAIIYDDPGANRGRASLIQPEGASGGHAVDVVRLDRILAGKGNIRLVKMDIEGYELEALKGLSELLHNTDRPMLMIECSGKRENSHGQGTQAIFEHLESVGGYRYFMPAKGKERPSRLIELKGHAQFPEHDNVLCLTSEHLQSIPQNVSPHRR